MDLICTNVGKIRAIFSALERCSGFGQSELVQVVYQVRVATPSAQAQNRIQDGKLVFPTAEEAAYP
jgi:hypothetical protein